MYKKKFGDPSNTVTKTLNIMSKFEFFPLNKSLEPSSPFLKIRYLILTGVITVLVIWTVSGNNYINETKIVELADVDFDRFLIFVYIYSSQLNTLVLALLNVIKLHRTYELIRILQDIQFYKSYKLPPQKLLIGSKYETVSAFSFLIFILASFINDLLKGKKLLFYITIVLSAYTMLRIYIFHYFTVSLLKLQRVHINTIKFVTKQMIRNRTDRKSFQKFGISNQIDNILNLTHHLSVVSLLSINALGLQVLFLVTAAFIRLLHLAYVVYATCMDNPFNVYCSTLYYLLYFFTGIIFNIALISATVRQKVNDKICKYIFF